MRGRFTPLSIASAACLLVVGVWFAVRTEPKRAGTPETSAAVSLKSAPEAAKPKEAGVGEAVRKAVLEDVRRPTERMAETPVGGASDAVPDQADEDQRKAEEEKRVDAFDNLTDTWTVPSEKTVSMADIDKFVATFRAVPHSRRNECVHRALNLVPDENVMLLAGILMDKTMDKEIVETVYGDILNRDEGVKKPILQEIFRDKTHPCWTDTAWILDVTGEIPKKK